MKIKKIALLVLVCMLLASVLTLAIACNDPEDQWDGKIDLMNAADWEGNESETVYTIYEEGGKLVFEYEKSDTYQYVKRTFIDDLDKLAQIKTVVIKAAVETTGANPNFMLKMEGTYVRQARADEVPTTAKTYEWDVSKIDLTKETRLLVFADCDDATAVGKIIISEFYLTTASVNAANEIGKVEDMEDYAWNEITATNTKVNAGWYDVGDGVYTAEAVSNGYKISVTKGEGNEYSAFAALIYGEAIRGMKSFKITVKGEVGQAVLVKPFDNAETRIDFDGTEQTVIIDVEKFASDELRDYTQKDLSVLQNINALTNDNRVNLIAMPGANSGSTEFTIISAEFSTEPAPEPEVKEEVTEITANNGVVATAWYEEVKGTYANEADGNALKVTYAKKDTYQGTYANVKGAAIANMRSIKFTLRGTEGKTVMVKGFGAEKSYTFSGEEEVLYLDIASKVAGGTFDTAQRVTIIAEPGTADVNGEFRIIKVEFSTDSVPAEELPQAIEYNGDRSLNINNYWHDGGDKKWNVSESEGIWTATFPAGNNWAQLITEVKLGDAVMNYVVLEVKGTAGTKAIFNVGVGEAKFEGNPGDHGVMTGDWQKVVVKGGTATGNVTIRVYAGLSEECAAGEIQIKTAQMYYMSATAVAEQNLNINVEGALANAVKGSTRNNISFEAGKTTISYTAPGWDSMIMWVDLGEGGFDTFDMEFKGLQGHTAILSLNGMEAKYEGNPDDQGTFTGETQTLSVPVSQLKGVIFIRIFLDMNKNDVNENGGSFEITKAEFTRAA